MKSDDELKDKSVPAGPQVSADEINALPDRIRKYIHDLERRADPADDVQLIAELREQVARLTRLLEEQKRP
jgi:hypothetical protein